MDSLFRILKASFRMLLDRPKIFVPKIFSSALTSSLIIGFITGNLSLFHLGLSMPFIAVLGVFTPVMVSSMVKNSEEEEMLEKGFLETVRNWRGVLTLSMISIAFSVIITFLTVPGFIAYLKTGNILFLGLSAGVALLLTLGSSFILYFTPIAIVGHERLGSSLKNAFNTSIDHRKEVLVLTVFSFSLLLIASASSSFLEELSLVGFFAGRIVSSIVGTYILVVSPNYYIEESGKLED